MWKPATRTMTFSGTAMVNLGIASPPAPLPGVLVEPLSFTLDGSGNATLEALEFSDRADENGDFGFIDLPVTVQVQTVNSSIPPYDEYEITHPGSLPNLAFRLFIESHVLEADLSTSGTQYTEVFLETPDAAWAGVHPERINVPLTGSPVSVARSLPLATSHNLILRSKLPEASVLPSGLKARLDTTSSNPSSTQTVRYWPVSINLTLPSSSATAISGATGDTAIVRIALNPGS